MKNRTYVSGPMTGIADFNRPAFNAAADRLRAQGHDVVNPADVNLGPGATWEAYMRVDLADMMTCDTIYMIAGWENSRGARIERRLAMDLGLTVIYADERVAA
jgi:hypothetical protein